MSQGRVDTRYLIIGTILGLAGIMAFTTMGMEMGEDFAVPGLIALAIVGIVILKGPVGKVLARRIENGPGVQRQDEVLAEMDDLRGRVMELEERLDFTERMLSKAREPERIDVPLR